MHTAIPMTFSSMYTQFTSLDIAGKLFAIFLLCCIIGVLGLVMWGISLAIMKAVHKSPANFRSTDMMTKYVQASL